MKSSRSRWAHFTRTTATLLSTSLCACAYSTGNRDIDRTPIVNTGAGATIINPGRGAPTYSTGGQSGPRGGVIGAGRGSNEAPTVAAPHAPYGAVGAPGTSRGTSSQNGGPGAEVDRPTVSFMGGSEEDEVSHNSYTSEPILLKYLTLPFAMLAAPVKAAVDVAKGEPQPGPAVPRETHHSRLPAPTAAQQPNHDTARAQPGYSAPAPQPQATPPPRASRVPRDYESVQLEKMERELARRQGLEPGGGGFHSAAGTTANTASPVMSIADELAALQRTAPAPRETPNRDAEINQRVSRPQTANPGSGGGTSAVAGPGLPSRGAGGLSKSALSRADGIVDRNGDGVIDHWIFRENGRLAMEVLDDDFDGRGERTIHYDAATHRVARGEEDFNRDTAVDSWTDYRDGRVIRRRNDADHDGVVDSWTYYREGEISRTERDTTGDGFRDRVGYYSGGRLGHEQLDHDGDGRSEVTVRYDAAEQISAREEDLDGDGSIDLISHFENGKIVSRELLDPAALQRGKTPAEQRR